MANAISDHISRTLLRTDYSGLEPVAQDLIDRIVELAPHPMPEPAKSSWLDDLADRIARHDPAISVFQAWPLLDADRRLSGIITRGDLIRALLGVGFCVWMLVELFIQERAEFKDRKESSYFEHRRRNLSRWTAGMEDLMDAGYVRRMDAPWLVGLW